jgi:small-conductance mechanosensitive channel
MNPEILQTILILVGVVAFLAKGTLDIAKAKSNGKNDSVFISRSISISTKMAQQLEEMRERLVDGNREIRDLLKENVYKTSRLTELLQTLIEEQRNLMDVILKNIREVASTRIKCPLDSKQEDGTDN